MNLLFEFQNSDIRRCNDTVEIKDNMEGKPENVAVITFLWMDADANG
jgi:hypothetical protein